MYGELINVSFKVTEASRKISKLVKYDNFNFTWTFKYKGLDIAKRTTLDDKKNKNIFLTTSICYFINMVWWMAEIHYKERSNTLRRWKSLVQNWKEKKIYNRRSPVSQTRTFRSKQVYTQYLSNLRAVSFPFCFNWKQQKQQQKTTKKNNIQTIKQRDSRK